MLRRLAAARDTIADGLAPTLGQLWQYESRPLMVPAWYLRAEAPDPPPSIALVTPSLDHGRYVARAVESVLSQGYPALQYVVRDGGSADDTLARLELYRPRLTKLESAPDGGQAAAINAGFAETDGEIMGWLNADDVLLPGALAHVARFFDRHPAVDVVYGDRLVIDEYDREIGRWPLPPHHPGVLRWTDFLPQEATFWRRSAWERWGPLDANLHFALDWDLFRRFAAGGARFAHTRRYLAGFRRHANQKTSFDGGDPVPEPCAAELRELTRRWDGFEISVEEMHIRSQPYRLRAVPARLLDRLLEQVRHPRIPVYFPQ